MCVTWLSYMCVWVSIIYIWGNEYAAARRAECGAKAIHIHVCCSTYSHAWEWTHLYVCDMTHLQVCVIWLIDVYLCGMTLSHVRRVSFIRVWHDSFMCVRPDSSIFELLNSQLQCNAVAHVEWGAKGAKEVYICVCGMTHSHARDRTHFYVRILTHLYICDMTHLYGRCCMSKCNACRVRRSRSVNLYGIGNRGAIELWRCVEELL